jgi:hypothetical protein
MIGLFLVLCLASALAFQPRFATKGATKSSLYSSLESSTDAVPDCGLCPMAPKCNGDYIYRGCDGAGKIQGGIQLYLKWWPIKVFRPCPAYLAAGYQYRREGQTLDQVLFSEPSTKMKEKMDELRKVETEAKEERKSAKAEEMAAARAETKAQGKEDRSEEIEEFLKQKFPDVDDV